MPVLGECRQPLSTNLTPTPRRTGRHWRRAHALLRGALRPPGKGCRRRRRRSERWLVAPLHPPAHQQVARSWEETGCRRALPRAQVPPRARVAPPGRRPVTQRDWPRRRTSRQGGQQLWEARRRSPPLSAARGRLPPPAPKGKGRVLAGAPRLRARRSAGPAGSGEVQTRGVRMSKRGRKKRAAAPGVGHQAQDTRRTQGCRMGLGGAERELGLPVLRLFRQGREPSHGPDRSGRSSSRAAKFPKRGPSRSLPQARRRFTVSPLQSAKGSRSAAPQPHHLAS